ncbi:MAG: TIGR03619 family F420-dependent LLM class oxidoreductase, partial [Armatimonadetes bacterium]|nr:TIGR03619 family F420-dependent LLM class oxidoreductase [Armatimonadota bacterium]
MAGNVTFGVRLPNSGPFATRDALLDVARAADHLGFDAIWVHDHIPWSREKRTHFAAGSIEAVGDQDPNFFESLSTLAYLGGMAPRLRLGVAGLVVPLRDPRVLAKQAATLHEMSGGRLILAIGIGAIPNDFEIMGVPFHRRGKITDEYLRAMLALFSEAPEVTFQGQRVQFASGEFYPKPRHLPIWIAGMSEAAYRRMAWAGSGWLPVYLSPEEYGAQAEQMHRVLREAGR